MKGNSPPPMMVVLAVTALAAILCAQNLPTFASAFISPHQPNSFHSAAAENAHRQSSKFINVETNTSTRLNLSSNNIFRRIGNTVESSLANAQSLLFYGRLPGPLPDGMHSVPTQFIAALGDPKSSSAKSGAEQWGIWRIDPGPRGVYLKDFQSNPSLGNENARMWAGWKFDPSDFWIEEYGRVMEKPDFPLTPGRYLVTGGRKTKTLLTIDPPNDKGEQGWMFEDDTVTLYDVTHLPCRSARYIPKSGEKRSPADANWSDFPVIPGGEMPAVQGCNKQDYAVLFVLAVED